MLFTGSSGPVYVNGFYPHLPSGPVSLTNWTSPFPVLGVTGLLFRFYSISIANSEDPDQTPRSAASDLGLHCLPMSQKWNAGLIWVKIK